MFPRLLPLLLAVLLAAAPGCDRKPSAIAPAGDPAAQAPATAPGAAPAPRWSYRVKVTRDGETAEAGATDTAQLLDLVETGRREVAGATVHDLVAEADGRRLTEDDLDRLGLTTAPFPEFAPHLAIAVGKHEGKPAAWLLLGSQPPDEDEVRTLLAEDPTWPLDPAAAQAHAPATPRPDEEDVYKKRIGDWPSLCAALQHPSPESGDTYSYERCFSPEVGLTRLEFESVWGGHVLELVTAPQGWRR